MKKGFSLIELIVVMGITAILIAIAMSQFTQANDKSKITGDIQGYASLVASLEAFRGQCNSATFDNALAIKLNLVPIRMVKDTALASIKNSYLGDVTISCSASGVPQFTSSNLPLPACSGISNAMASSGYLVSVVGAGQVTNLATSVSECQLGKVGGVSTLTIVADVNPLLLGS